MKLKEINLKKIAKIMLILSILLIVIGFTFAYYNNTKTIPNVMQTSTSEMVLNEIFNENDYWVAGETKQKEVSFENTGEIEQLVRFTVEVVWLEQVTDVDGNTSWVEWTEQSTETIEAVTINYSDYLLGATDITAQWTEIDGYYYYNTTLSPNTETDIVMESVYFSSSLDNGGYGSSLDYSNKQCSITIKMEAIDVNTDVALDQWEVNYTIDDDGTITWSANSTNEST